jgi:predicted nucleic acid-binding protein
LNVFEGRGRIPTQIITGHFGQYRHKLRSCDIFIWAEGAITHAEFKQVLSEFQRDSAQGAVEWLLHSPAVAARLVAVYATLPATVPLRAADGLHLACAAENGFKEVYSNDARFLAAAAHFGLKGTNIF